MQFDRKIFFDQVRPLFGGSMTVPQVAGCELILAEFERRQWADVRHLAYIFATVQHETASTMEPIEEYGKGAGKPYGQTDPVTGQRYYGRGYVQLTWKANYAHADDQLATGGAFVRQPATVMQPAYALAILYDGMGEGWFSGDKSGRHNLTRYFNPGRDDAVAARRIINGTDRAAQIAAKHSKYLAALKAATIPPAAG